MAGFTAGSKTYDGTTAATVQTRTLAGVIGSDDVSLIGGTASFNNANAGAGKTVTLTGTTLGGYKVMHHSDVEWKNRAIPDYPEAAREMNLGEVECRVRMFVDEKGMPNDIEFVACPKVFQDTTREAFFKSRWYPAKVDNAKTRAQFLLVYKYVPPK